MREERYHRIDEALVPFHEHVNGMLKIENSILSKEDAVRLEIYEMNIESPIQLDIEVSESGEVVVGSSPPLYYVETGIMPVFHRLRLKVVAEEKRK